MEFISIASGSSGNCYKLSDGETSILIECGIPVKKIKEALNFSLSSISGCLVTHYHGDHAKSIKNLVKLGVDVYASEETFAAMNVSGHRCKKISPLKSFDVGSFAVMPFDVEHDAEGSLGFLIYSRETKERLLYFTDTKYLRYKFSGIDILAGEANYQFETLEELADQNSETKMIYPRIINSHMGIDGFIDVVRSLDATNLKKIYLLHLSKANADPEKFKRKVEEETGVEVTVCS